MDLVVVAEEDIEAVLFRNTGGSPAPATPLPESTSGVAERLQDRGHRRFPIPEGRAASVGTDRGMAAVFSGHQATACRGADRGPREALGEPDPLGGEAVEIRGPDVRVPHVSQFIVAELVGHDINDVRLVGCVRDDAAGENEEQDESVHFAVSEG